MERRESARGLGASDVGPVLAHLRASSGTAIQQTNCHPFRHGRWLFMHNGLIEDFPAFKRDLVLDVKPSLYASIEGQTDFEVLFQLALTFGARGRPAGADGRSGRARRGGRPPARVEHPIQMTVATTDGERIWAFRYSSAGPVAIALPDHGRADALPDVPVAGAAGARVGRRAPDRVRAAGIPQGRLARGTGGDCVVVAGGEAEIVPFAPTRSTRALRPAHLAGSRPA